MEHCLTVNSISECIGLSPRMVRIRAQNERWPTVGQRVRGGPRKLFPTSLLPDDVRAAVFSTLYGGESSGFIRGLGVNAEAMAAKIAKQDEVEAKLAAYNALTDEQKDEAYANEEILKARDGFLAATKLPKKKGTLLFIKEVKAGTIKFPPNVTSAMKKRKGKIVLSWSTFYRWETEYKENGPAGLARNYVSMSKTSVPEHMQKFIQAMIVDHPHVSIPGIRMSIKARFDGQEIPSAHAIRRYVSKWKDENESLLLYLKNPDEWKNRKMFAFGDASEQVFRLNQLWEYDSTPGDVMLTDGRHTIIGVIDVYSRRIKLLVSPTSKAESVAALTRRALLDWGVPESAKTDNGADYVSRHMVRIFSDLEVEQVLCPPFSPEKKPHIERAFKTFSHSIVELLPGYIGHSVADRKAIESRRTFAQRMMKQGSDPVDIKISSDEFQEICDRWVDAIYHHNSHDGLDGMTPAQVARDWTGPVRRISNERALDILLSPAPSDGGFRDIRRKGIRVENAWFITPELAGHEGRVRVLLDRTDYGTIYVFGEDGTYICTAVNPDRTGHNRKEIADKAKDIQKKVMREGSRELKKVAREAKTRFIHDEILGYRESKIANIVDHPKQSEEYSTGALDEAAMAVEDMRRKELGPSPIAISEDEEERAKDVIRLADKQANRMPSTQWEKYEYLTQDLADGKYLPDADLAWMKRYEHFLQTGKMASCNE